MTKPDDLYECEHCRRCFYVKRKNGIKGPVQHECKCGKMADRWPYIPRGYAKNVEVELMEVK